MSADRVKGNLTQEEAAVRAAAMTGNLNYSFFYDFRKGENYSGLVRIEFRLKTTEGIFLDFCGDKVEMLTINGTTVADLEAVRTGAKIALDAALLRTDKINIVNVKYSNRYYNDGNGVMTFTDVDGSQYLYTQSEPFWGNRVSPMFDQPDLKAQFKVHVATPSQWQVIATEACKYSTPWNAFVEGGYGSDFYKLLRTTFGEAVPAEHTFWEFPPTPPLSTYLLNVVCGPYEKVELATEKRYRGLPMTIYCRKTLLEFAKVEAHNIFEFNKRGVEFYERVFNLEYPFSKLDTIFCPDFTVGAMEYPGAVTYTERLLPREKNTTRMVSLRGSVILHELAHMWFGNMVTMKWWNDLWLNESFADFVCYMAWADIIPKLDFATYDAWLSFMGRKGWGYKEDQEKTTHNICGHVADTNAADSIFDGITYSKGAASMRHLVSIVGEEIFSKAMSEYFSNYKWSNTVLKDLLDIYKAFLNDRKDEHKVYDIEFWEQTWLNTAGVNTVTPEWKNGATELVLRQGAALAEHPTLRCHRIDVAYIGESGEVIDVAEAVLDPAETTTLPFTKKEGVAAVLPNYRDFSFIKIQFDDVSQAWFAQNLHLLKENLSKGLVLRAMYDAVRDARLPANEFLDAIIAFIPREDDNQVLDLAYGFIGAATSILTSKLSDEYLSKLYAVTRAKLLAASDPQFILSLIQKLVGYGALEADVKDLAAWLDGSSEELKKFELTNALKWSIVCKIAGTAGYTAEQRQAVFDAQWAADETDEKKKYKLKYDAIVATDEARDQLWEAYFSEGEGGMNFEDLSYSTDGFTSRFVPLETRQKYFAKYFEAILAAMKGKTKSVARVLFRGLMPSSDDTEMVRDNLAKISAAVKAEEKPDIFLTKAFGQALEEKERLVKCRALLN